MKRRLFLAGVFAAPALALAAKAAEEASRTADDVSVTPVHSDAAMGPNAANLGAVVASGKIRSADGKAVIDFGNGTVTFLG